MKAIAVVVAAFAVNVSLEGHHSFAVFFDDAKNITVTGTVTDFRFTNPHALITVIVTKDGREETWKGETNAQTLLRRRGWTSTSLKAGDVVTIDGWPSRDGKPYMRVRRVTLADGTVVGGPAGTERSGEQR
jgi:hypothetical protein